MYKSVNILKTVSPEGVFQLNKTSFDDILKNSHSKITLQLPIGNELHSLELNKSELFGSNFYKTYSSSQISQRNLGSHYKGKLSGFENSSVAVSFTELGFVGLILDGENQYEISPFGTDSYKVLPVEGVHEFECGAGLPPDYDEEKKNSLENNLRLSSNGDILMKSPTATTRCLNVYWEADTDIYNTLGVNSESYLASLFNAVQLLFSNDGIQIYLSDLFVNSGTSFYYPTIPSNQITTLDMLYEFEVVRPTFNGDAAQLFSFNKGSGGGVAWVDALCSRPYAFCWITSSFQQPMTYSWTVAATTHEHGHTFGSPHTFSCSWNTNNFQPGDNPRGCSRIDSCRIECTAILSSGCTTAQQNPGYGTCRVTSSTNCGACCAPNYCCGVPGSPAEGGTIMSYCHQVSVGTNLNLGFGPQPRQRMLDAINSLPSTCIECLGPPPPEDTPTPTPTKTKTPTPTKTINATPNPTPTNTQTKTPTSTFGFNPVTPSQTRTPTKTPTITPTKLNDCCGTIYGPLPAVSGGTFGNMVPPSNPISWIWSNQIITASASSYNYGRQWADIPGNRVSYIPDVDSLRLQFLIYYRYYSDVSFTNLVTNQCFLNKGIRNVNYSGTTVIPWIDSNSPNTPSVIHWNSDWDYTIKFETPVNNVKLFAIMGTSISFGPTEGLTFMSPTVTSNTLYRTIINVQTNQGTPNLIGCLNCGNQVSGNTLYSPISANTDCDTSTLSYPLYGNAGFNNIIGVVLFTVSSPTPYTSITFSGTRVPTCMSRFGLCYDINELVTPTPTPTICCSRFTLNSSPSDTNGSTYSVVGCGGTIQSINVPNGSSIEVNCASIVTKTSGLGTFIRYPGCVCTTPTPTPTQTITPTITPTVTSTKNLAPCNQYSCNTPILSSMTVNGISITVSLTGESIINSFQQSGCSVITPVNALTLGATTPYTYNFTFSSPITSIVMNIFGAGLFATVCTEVFTLNTNSGNPSITSPINCFATIVNNVITIDTNGSLQPGGGGGKFLISNTIPFTSVSVSGLYACNGSIIVFCADSLICPEPTPTQTNTPTPTQTPNSSACEYCLSLHPCSINKFFSGCCEPFDTYRIYTIPSVVADTLVDGQSYYVESVGFSGCAIYDSALTTADFSYEYINITAT